MIQKRIKSIIEEIQYDINNDYSTKLTFEEVKEIVESQFKVIKDTIKEFNIDDTNTHKDLRLPYLGSIYVAPSRIKYKRIHGKKKD